MVSDLSRPLLPKLLNELGGDADPLDEERQISRGLLYECLPCCCSLQTRNGCNARVSDEMSHDLKGKGTTFRDTYKPLRLGEGIR